MEEQQGFPAGRAMFMHASTASCHQWSDNSAKPQGKAEWAATAQGAEGFCGSPPFWGAEALMYGSV